MLLDQENIKKWYINSKIVNYPRELIRISNEVTILQIDKKE